MSGRGKQVEGECEKLLRAGGGFVHRNEPRMSGRIPVRGGLPDYTLIRGGVAHYVEVKHGQGTSLRLGCLTAPADGAKEPAGVTSLQAATMDAIEAAGGRCYLYARLDSPHGSAAGFVSWRVWRGWLAEGRLSVRPVELAAAAAPGI